MIRYWKHIMETDNSSLLRQTYDFLKKDVDLDHNYRGQNWAYQIKVLLEEHGFGYLWVEQRISIACFNLIKQRIMDVYRQTWYSQINESERLKYYSTYKKSFELENYLDTILENKLRINLTRFRISSLNLNVETGRYINTPHSNRLCKSCNLKAPETEYHFLLVCPRYRDLRKKYFKKYFCHWPSMWKFKSLMSSSSQKAIVKLSSFIYFANQIRVP